MLEYSLRYQKEYRKTEAGKKASRITTWKSRGVVCDDWDALYNKYINCKNCEKCKCELVEGSGSGNNKHLDHDHTTGLFRNILCGKCNINEKK